MSKQYKLALHIFRRDLRTFDNTALIHALASAEKVITCFIFDERQIENNAYKSEHCIQFMLNSLDELGQDIKQQGGHLQFFFGKAENVMTDLINTHPIEGVFVNRDYTPFSRKRDQAMADICQKHGIDFHVYADALLQEPEQIFKPTDNKPYTVFTPFFKRASLFPVTRPVKNSHHHYYAEPIKGSHTDLPKKFKKDIYLALKGGRKEALKLLTHAKSLTDYKNLRDYPALESTTKLSAHHKFGTVSIREVYYTLLESLGKTSTLITELYWRDFFTHIAFHFPNVFSEAFNEKYRNIKWSENPKHFQAWCHGETGFPIVDAGMRELNSTGFMHNRVRMITASFLTKDLHIDWRWGEKYFAQKLIDYDPAVNNGNWQWAASTGCDAQPYFRIFNPWLQQQKYDPNCEYIKKYVPELTNIPVEMLHKWADISQDTQINYPAPMVDHKKSSEKAKLLYKYEGKD